MTTIGIAYVPRLGIPDLRRLIRTSRSNPLAIGRPGDCEDRTSMVGEKQLFAGNIPDLDQIGVQANHEALAIGRPGERMYGFSYGRGRAMEKDECASGGLPDLECGTAL